VADVAQRVLLRQVPRRVGRIRIAVRYISAVVVVVVVVVLVSFRESAYDAPDLAAIAEHIELSLRHQAPEEKFVTAILAEITGGGAEIRLLNCGHPAPLLVSGGLARLAEPVEAALPLGLAGLADGDRKGYTVPFGPDDRMLCYTDGISEARDTSGAFYPVGRCGQLLAGPDPAG
jgi:serine phosphatase RsbU (regulator of sigma subunit)